MSAIEVTNVSKKYRIYHNANGGVAEDTFRARLSSLFKNPISVISSSGYVDFWALKNISFKVNKGDVLGVIGYNGAGKSTLLKILSQVTPPTRGEITIKGRIASLLEIGTGFHPELTGRENIYLYGSIIGMDKREIDKHYQSIVDFSGVEKFLDTPVKKYSSGMRLRLAFSVSVYLNSDIILIDEILSVGDYGFRKKCYEKILSITSKSDKTVIIVGHDMHTIRSLCNNCILLDEGKIVMHDRTDLVADRYIKKIENEQVGYLDGAQKRMGQKNIWFERVNVFNSLFSDQIRSGDGLRIEMDYDSNFKDIISDLRIAIAVSNEENFKLTKFDNMITKKSFSYCKPKGRIICNTNAVNFERGKYYLTIVIYVSGILQDRIEKVGVNILDNYDPFQFIDYNKYRMVSPKKETPILIGHSFTIE